jgi:hypothetical protein
MSVADPDRPDFLPLVYQPGTSMHEVIVDALSRVLLETDMALELLSDPRTPPELRWIKTHLRNVFDEVNGVMLQITD